MNDDGPVTVDGLANDEGTVTWRELLDEAVHRLGGASMDARRIVEEASGNDGADFALGLDDAVTERQMARYDDMVSRRLNGEPLQYVLGRWGFRTLDLAVDCRVLIPRPETEMVVDVALGHLDRIASDTGRRADELVAVDLGTGSGAIALSIAAERTGATVWATERSSEALIVARGNLAGLGRAARRVQMTEGSWFEALPSHLLGTVDVLVSNPPYVAAGDDIEDQVVAWEPSDALFADDEGRADLLHIVEHAPRWLRPGGALVLELDPGQVQAVTTALQQAGFVDIVTHRDLTGRDRALSASTAASTASGTSEFAAER